MDVHIVAREVIKPSSLAIQHKKPYKFSLFDQLTPTTYAPVIYFYPNNNHSEPNLIRQTLTHLKESLSQTLDLYYPFSGRTNDNLYVDRFDEGVPFFEAKVKCSMSDFLKRHETEWLNRFLPCRPFTKEVNISIPFLAFQVTIFTCGGIALGWCMSHKLFDGLTASAFVTTWASIFRGELQDVIKPDLNEASLVFPPKISFPQKHLSLMESLWFTKANYVTRRFVFDAKAISTLRDRTKGKLAVPPSRIETLSCFIWKCSMTASKIISGTTKPSILAEAVNLRQKTKPPMSDASSGNLFWWAIAVANPTDTNTELHDLVGLLSEAIAVYKSDYTHTLQGEDGFEILSDYCDQLEELFSLEKPDIFAFTSWNHMSLSRPNFGWGEPFWVGVMGKAGAEFRNLTVFIDTTDGKGIEAWITLDEQRMAILQHDPEFLAFASPNPRISSL